MDKASQQFIQAAIERLDLALDQYGEMSYEAREKLTEAKQLMKEALKKS